MTEAYRRVTQDIELKLQRRQEHSKSWERNLRITVVVLAVLMFVVAIYEAVQQRFPYVTAGLDGGLMGGILVHIYRKAQAKKEQFNKELIEALYHGRLTLDDLPNKLYLWNSSEMIDGSYITLHHWMSLLYKDESSFDRIPDEVCRAIQEDRDKCDRLWRKVNHGDNSFKNKLLQYELFCISSEEFWARVAAGTVKLADMSDRHYLRLVEKYGHDDQHNFFAQDSRIVSRIWELEPDMVRRLLYQPAIAQVILDSGLEMWRYCVTLIDPPGENAGLEMWEYAVQRGEHGHANAKWWALRALYPAPLPDAVYDHLWNMNLRFIRRALLQDERCAHYLRLLSIDTLWDYYSEGWVDAQLILDNKIVLDKIMNSEDEITLTNMIASGPQPLINGLVQKAATYGTRLLSVARHGTWQIRDTIFILLAHYSQQLPSESDREMHELIKGRVQCGEFFETLLYQLAQYPEYIARLALHKDKLWADHHVVERTYRCMSYSEQQRFHQELKKQQERATELEEKSTIQAIIDRYPMGMKRRFVYIRCDSVKQSTDLDALRATSLLWEARTKDIPWVETEGTPTITILPPEGIGEPVIEQCLNAIVYNDIELIASENHLQAITFFNYMLCERWIVRLTKRLFELHNRDAEFWDTLFTYPPLLVTKIVMHSHQPILSELAAYGSTLSDASRKELIGQLILQNLMRNQLGVRWF